MEEIVMGVADIFEPLLYLMCGLIAAAFYNVVPILAAVPLLFIGYWFIFGPRVSDGFCGMGAYQSRWEELNGIHWCQSFRRQ